MVLSVRLVLCISEQPHVFRIFSPFAPNSILSKFYNQCHLH